MEVSWTPDSPSAGAAESLFDEAAETIDEAVELPRTRQVFPAPASGAVARRVS
jgi:hypothetical protein